MSDMDNRNVEIVSTKKTLKKRNSMSREKSMDNIFEYIENVWHISQTAAHTLFEEEENIQALKDSWEVLSTMQMNQGVNRLVPLLQVNKD